MMKKRQRKKGKSVKVLHQIQLDAAGIDIGTTEIYVAIPDDHRASETIRCFGTFTQDLHETARWLQSCESSLSPWNRQVFTGFPSFKFLRYMVLRCSSLMLAMLKTSLAVRPMCRIASGYNTSTPSVCSKVRTVLQKMFAPYEHYYDIVTAW